MLDTAQPLTWVDDLLPLRRAPEAISVLIRRLGRNGRLAVIGGDAMPLDFHREIADALTQDTSQIAMDITARIAPLMRRKSARELAAIRQSCATLNAAIAALGTAWCSTAAVTPAILAAEATANRAGVQDVRTLFSLDGGPTLVPFTGSEARRIDPLQVYMAVRKHGYWAEGFAMFSTRPSAAQCSAVKALRAGVAAARPGLPRRALGELLTMRPAHPVVGQAPVAAIGLALEELWSEEAKDELLVPGSVYSFRVGILNGSAAAIASAMVAITSSGAEVLWAPM